MHSLLEFFLSSTVQIAKTKEETSIRMLLSLNFDFGNRIKGPTFQLCVHESWFISHVILSSHKKCESSKGFSHLAPCYYGVSGSLHVGLAVNISGLLYMVCCKVPPTLVFCFPPSCVELMSKPFIQGELSLHSLTSVSWGLEELGGVQR